MKRYIHILGIVLTGVLVFWFGYFFGAQKKKSNPLEIATPNTPDRSVSSENWFVVDSSVILKQEELVARVQFRDELSVRAAASGTIDFLHPNWSNGRKLLFNEVLYRIKMDEAFLDLSKQKTELIRLIDTRIAEIEQKFPSEQSKWKKWKEDLVPSKRFSGSPRFSNDEERLYAINNGILQQFQEIRIKELEMEGYIKLLPSAGYIIHGNCQIGSYVRKGDLICTISSSEAKKVVFCLNRHQAASFDLSAIDLRQRNGKSLTGTITESNWKEDCLMVTVKLEDAIPVGTLVRWELSPTQNSCKIPAVFLMDGVLKSRRNNQFMFLRPLYSSQKGQSYVIIKGLQLGDSILYKM